MRTETTQRESAPRHPLRHAVQPGIPSATPHLMAAVCGAFQAAFTLQCRTNKRPS
jgi:hypothetical protein